MAYAKAKPEEKNEYVIEEKTDKFQQGSSSTIHKHKRDEDITHESSSNYKRTSYGNRFSTTTVNNEDSLTVPFWKKLNYRQSSIDFHTNEIGNFSLLTHDNEKQCFDDKRYLRGKYLFLLFSKSLNNLYF